MTRDVQFDEEVAERDPEVQESLTDVRPMTEVEAMRARWARHFDDTMTRRCIEDLRLR